MATNLPPDVLRKNRARLKPQRSMRLAIVIQNRAAQLENPTHGGGYRATDYGWIHRRGACVSAERAADAPITPPRSKAGRMIFNPTLSSWLNTCALKTDAGSVTLLTDDSLSWRRGRCFTTNPAGTSLANNGPSSSSRGRLSRRQRVKNSDNPAARGREPGARQSPGVVRSRAESGPSRL
jgi:hypothetical protein